MNKDVTFVYIRRKKQRRKAKFKKDTGFDESSRKTNNKENTFNFIVVLRDRENLFKYFHMSSRLFDQILDLPIPLPPHHES